MAKLTISEVARQVGLRPSAIRYYEQRKLLLPPQRVSGQRRYDDAVLYRLVDAPVRVGPCSVRRSTSSGSSGAEAW